MKIERIDRVSIAVKDLEKAMQFFSDLLGTKFDEVRENDHLKIRATYGDDGIELVQPTDESSSVDKFIQSRGEGVLTVALKVPDLEEAQKSLQEKGLRLIGEIRRGGLKEAVFHRRDSYGVQITLCEYEVPHPATCAALHVS